MYWSRKFQVLVVWCAAAAIASADVADDDFRVASRQFSRKRWAPAVTELAAFIKNHPEHRRSADARYLLGESLVQLRNYPEARKHLLQFLLQTNGHRYARQAEFRAAESAFHAAQYVAARTELERFRERYPDDVLRPYVITYLGEIALVDRDGQMAIDMFSKALQHETDKRLDSQCRFGLAQAYELMGNAKDAIQLYGQAVEPADRYSQQAQFRIAMLRYQQAEYRLAEPLLEDLAAATDDDFLFEAQYWLGMSRLSQQKWSAAASALQEGLEDKPAHRLVTARRFALAEALRQGGHTREAKKLYTTVFQRDPPVEWSDDAGQILVLLAWKAGNLAEVHEIAGKFFNRFPLSRLTDDVRQQQGRAWLKEQEFVAAVQLFESLLKMHDEPRVISPELDQEIPAHQIANRYYLAIAYLGAKRPTDVLRVLPAAEIEVHDDELNDGVRVARASALMALGRYEQAIGPLQNYVSKHADGADSVDCHAKLIVALGRTGRWNAATASFDRFARRHPDSRALVTTAAFLADEAHAQGVHDVAERMYGFLIDQSSVATQATSDQPQPGKTNSGNRILQSLLGLARSQFDRGRFLEATQTHARLLALSPSASIAATALLLQGRAFEANAQPNDALASYQLVYENDPLCDSASTALFAAASILSNQGNRKQACQRLEQLVAQHTKFDHRDDAIYQFAWLLREAGDDTQADLRFAQLVKEHQRSPLWADAAFRLARSAANRNDVKQANHWLEELLFGVERNASRDHSISHDSPGESATTKTDDSDIVCHALYLQGKLAIDADEWLGALRSYQRIVEEYPQSDLASAASFWSAEAQFQLAQFQQADVMLAQLQLTSADADPEYRAMIPLRRAQIAMHRRQWTNALKLAEGIRSQFPNFNLQFEADYLIGRCLNTQARFSLARQSFRQVINAPQARRTETAAMAQWMIGETYFHQTNYNDAIRAYYRVDSLYDLPRWQAAALLQAAKCHELNDQWKEAQQLYGQLCSDYPESQFAAEATRRLRTGRNSGAE